MRAGDTAGGEKLAAELDKTFPMDTVLQRYWLPTIRAAVALRRKDPNRAIELLKVASTVELGALLVLHLFAWGSLSHAARRQRSGSGISEVHRPPRTVVNFPWGALARLGLARAYAIQGDTAKARAAYHDFLTLWKDTDPDIPILKEAKAEYAEWRSTTSITNPANSDR